ncbi:MAG: hypothetical protein M3033_13645 [Acidobacteriota bacterium]|nr:hypothetical protein [Acidobacteriota bacterium]
MTSFLFWNINKKPLESLVKKLAFQYEIDVILLAEYESNPNQLLYVLNEKTFGYFLASSFCPKIRVFSRFRNEFFEAISESERFSIRNLRLPGLQDILLAVVHFPSKINFSNESQMFECVNLADSIREAEERVGHSRTVLVGDLNMNPFEGGIISSRGLHAVSSQRVAKKGNRTVQGKQYPFFYNPMWNFLGDFSPFPAGTHYYSGSEHITYFWNMYDQVLVRPELLDRFVMRDLKILDSVENKSLLTKDGQPNKNLASDHLPIIFRLEL